MRKVVGTSDEKAHLKESRAQDSCSSLVFVSADGTSFLNCIILRSGKSSTRPSKKKVSDDDDDEPDEGEQERYDEAVANELELDEDLENEPQQIDGEALDNALKTVKFADITRLVARSKRRSGFLHTAVFFTPTGRTNNAMFANAFNLFVRLYKAHVGDEHDKVARVNALLLLDNLGAHKVRDALDTILAAAEQQVHCRFLPTNTTHFAQPLDALVFKLTSLITYIIRRSIWSVWSPRKQTKMLLHWLPRRPRRAAWSRRSASVTRSKMRNAWPRCRPLTSESHKRSPRCV